jgi:hypothetical protein
VDVCCFVVAVSREYGNEITELVFVVDRLRCWRDRNGDTVMLPAVVP